MITDEEVDALREIAGRIRDAAEDSCYGFFCGGDPRDFTPDAECCTADEMARHAEDCAAWEAGDHVERHTHECLTGADGNVIGRALVSHYGLGVQSLRDENILKLAQDLDDVIDRIRQVSP